MIITWKRYKKPDQIIFKGKQMVAENKNPIGLCENPIWFFVSNWIFVFSNWIFFQFWKLEKFPIGFFVIFYMFKMNKESHKKNFCLGLSEFRWRIKKSNFWNWKKIQLDFFIRHQKSLKLHKNVVFDNITHNLHLLWCRI